MAGPGWSLTGLVPGTWGWGKTAEGGVPPLPGLLGVANVSPPARLITEFQVHRHQQVTVLGPEFVLAYPFTRPARPLGARHSTPVHLCISEPIWTAQGPNLCLPLCSQVLQGGQDMTRRMVCQQCLVGERVK